MWQRGQSISEPLDKIRARAIKSKHGVILYAIYSTFSTLLFFLLRLVFFLFLLMSSSWSGFWYGMLSVAHNTNPKNRLSRFPFLRQSKTSERQIEAPNHWITRWHVFMFTSFTLIYTNGNNNSFVYLETMANVAAFRVA